MFRGEGIAREHSAGFRCSWGHRRSTTRCFSGVACPMTNVITPANNPAGDLASARCG
jgi:hypothetical protein